jgi:tight adherence protein B
MNLVLVSLFSFLAATSLIIMIVMLALAAQTSPQARIRKRLMAVGSNPYASKSEVQSLLLKGTIYSQIPSVDAFLRRLDISRAVDLLLERANIDFSVSVFLLFSVFSGVIVFFVISLFGQPALVGLIGGIIACLIPYLYVRYLGVKRLRRFLEQMPDSLDMISQGLQAGLGLTQALVYTAKEMPDPIGTEFSVFMEEINLGLPLPEAMGNLQEKIPLQEVSLLSTALLVQREIGGSLADLLRKLGDVIRERFRLERQLKTLTAQNRISAWVVCSMPPALTAFMFWMGPELMNQMMSDPMGRMMMIGAVIFEIIGIFVFRKLIQIRF